MRILVLLLLLAALSGCFGDDGADGDGTAGGDDGSDDGTDDDTDTGEDDGTGAGNETDEAPEPRDPVTWTVDVGDNSFTQSDLTIQAGDTVEWVQSGSNPHTVTEDDGEFDSHPDCEEFQDSLLGNCMEEGDTFEQTFDTTGEVGYHCKIHGSSMTGTITVQEMYNETPEA